MACDIGIVGRSVDAPFFGIHSGKAGAAEFFKQLDAARAADGPESSRAKGLEKRLADARKELTDRMVARAKALRLGDVERFPFVEPPRQGMIREGYQTLLELGAVDERWRITRLGHELAKLPVDPRIGRMILAARQENSLKEVLIIAAALLIGTPFFIVFGGTLGATMMGFPLSTFKSQDQIALTYVCADGSPASNEYPFNPNGSLLDIAGLCNRQGNVLGLMPHPENHVHPYQHPQWTRRINHHSGLKLFKNGVRYASEM